jgi:hypothetical protein
MFYSLFTSYGMLNGTMKIMSTGSLMSRYCYGNSVEELREITKNIMMSHVTILREDYVEENSLLCTYPCPLISVASSYILPCHTVRLFC